jgi:hypothetical protein
VTDPESAWSAIDVGQMADAVVDWRRARCDQ